MQPLLELCRLEAAYGDARVLFGIDLQLQAGECVALIGANGAGKTTLLRTLCGLQPARAGTLHLAGQNLAQMSPEQIARAGVAMVPEGRMVFPSLSVEENLRMGAETGRPGPWSLARVQALFPLLRERRLHRPDSLSGGQQQMLAIGRALMSNPRLLLCDELSLGLAPIVVEDIYRALAQIRGEGMSVLLVEQDVQRACRAAERVVCLLKGRVTLQARSAELDRDALVQAYFG